jgi:hypothetical protein
MHVKDLRPSGGAKLDRRDELPGNELFYEVVDFLAVGDPGERGVLPADEHARVQHDGNEETRLPLSKTERFDGSSAFGREGIR